MSSLHLRSCTFSHAATLVVDDVDLDLADGWFGVVGANGAGKSTLLGLLAGQLTPARGEVHRVSALAPVLCPQEVGGLTADVQAFAWDWEGTSARLRSRLELDPDDLERWPSLSPGERKRWQVGAALAGEPDVLLLDEPTNHLDADARDWVAAALGEFTGLGVLVSHDRGLLDSLTSTTLRVVAGEVQTWSGSYSEARGRWVAHEQARRDAHDRARREERRVRRQVADARRDRGDSEATARARRRNAPKEADAREAGRKLAAQKAEAAHAQRVGAMHARLDRAEAAVDGSGGLSRELGGAVALGHRDTGRRWLATLRAERLLAGDHDVLRDVDLAVGRGERIHVTGANGSGKTTLLRAVLAEVREAGYLAQDHTPAESEQLLDDVRAADPAMRGRVLGILATLGVNPERVLMTARPSPGEIRKLALARLLAEPHELVALDEPTNHLDLPSIERLETALAGYPGALLLVTHDAALAAAVTTTRWMVRDGVVESGPAGHG